MVGQPGGPRPQLRHPVGDLVGLLRDGRPVPVLQSGSRRVQVAAHLPLHVGLLGLAVGLAKLVVGSDSLTQADGATALLAGPLAVVMGSLALVAYAGAVPSQRVLRLGAAAAAALVVVGCSPG